MALFDLILVHRDAPGNGLVVHEGHPAGPERQVPGIIHLGLNIIFFADILGRFSEKSKNKMHF